MTSLLNTWLHTAEMYMQIRIPLVYFYYFFDSLSIQMKHNFLAQKHQTLSSSTFYVVDFPAIPGFYKLSHITNIVVHCLTDLYFILP